MTASPNPRFDDLRLDPVWTQIRQEAETIARVEPLMASIVHATVLNHRTLEDALGYRIAQKLASDDMPSLLLREMCDQAYGDQPEIGIAARADIVAVYDRDPFCDRMIQPLLYFKGFIGIQSYRVAHWLWNHGRRDLAMFIQMRISQLFSMDINPAARIGRGLMIDHAHQIVIGETAVVGDDVSMLHGVTLGGTGKEGGDRHPKIGDGVLIGAGAKVLGNIRVGDCSRIAAGSVVLKDVPPCKTVAGIPAKIVGEAGCDRPSLSMNHVLSLDPEDIVPDC
ncbi:MAG: serine O-acetyltransferase [Pseudomonadota bacterium]